MFALPRRTFLHSVHIVIQFDSALIYTKKMIKLENADSHPKLVFWGLLFSGGLHVDETPKSTFLNQTA
jgi:hypothetical protein